MSEPIVTVITATYNSRDTLSLAITSVLNQDLSAWEMWVVGDACTDDSADVVASFADPRLHWTNLPWNSGSQGVPNNEGLRLAKGRYITYLGHDDLWFPWHLSGLIQCLESSEVDFVNSMAASITPKGSTLIGLPWSKWSYGARLAPPSSWMHRREIISDSLLWDDHIAIDMDIDRAFLRRIHQQNYRISHCSQLSVLKFPSPAWRSYVASSLRPQHTYLDQLLGDASDLENRLWREVAVASAAQLGDTQPLRTIFMQAFSQMKATVRDRYGEQWPISWLRRWSYRRQRQSKWRRRGLPPYQRQESP